MKKPRRFDCNLVVIGGGAAGLVAAYVAATAKAKVTLVEGHRMGGDCLNTGCVPSKALIRCARAARQLRDAERFGLQGAAGTVNFAAVMAHVHEAIRAIEPHDSVQRFRSLGVDTVEGRARVTSPWTVEILTPTGTQILSTRSIVVATGARPLVPPMPGLAEVGYLTSETVWSLTELPRRLVVLGGGAVGCELAQALARLGAGVTVVEAAPRLLTSEDEEAARLVDAAMREDGVEVLAGHRALRCERDGQRRRIVVTRGDDERTIEFDALLVAIGREGRVTGYGLEELGVALTPRKTIDVNVFLQTSVPSIYAIGDVAGPWQFTHAAAHQAWTAAVNALFGRFKRLAADRAVMPSVTYTDPEVARVGLTEDEARAQGIANEVTRYGIDELDRAIVDGAARGFVKLLTVPGKDRILGATIVGNHAGELLAEVALAMQHGLGLNKIVATVHAYPTWAEANKLAAAQWREAHLPPKLLMWAERLHAWRRGGPRASRAVDGAGRTKPR